MIYWGFKMRIEHAEVEFENLDVWISVYDVILQVS